jgi:hypothetical protein
MKFILGILGGTAFLALFLVIACAQMAAGYAGIEHSLGHFWAVAAVVVLIFFRISLPLTVGAFFGAMNVWGWHWALALLFAAPGLLFVVPGALAAAIAVAVAAASKLRRDKTVVLPD